MIANEMNRASRLTRPADLASRRLAYERVLRLADLTIATAERRAVRRELLRWRDLAAELYLAEDARPADQREVLRRRLLQTASSAAQVASLGL